ncbi:MAG: type I-E CRISPR-associated protein Cse1/CasA [Telmatospirillum sp.]|nr:type I-E CRISPR-associated protein Cse1/CasA [Telmatospirillum sp.]
MAPILWLDQAVRYRLASGTRCPATPLDVTAGHGDGDPIVDIDLGHPVLDAGFLFLMRDLLQIALPPRSPEDWIERFFDPPTPGELSEALAPYGEGLCLCHGETPMFQVRPSAERLAEVAKPAKRKKVAPPDKGEEEEDAPGELPISALLPDPPTPDAVRNDADFFVKRAGITAIGAGAVAPALYAHMILFPPAAGGYFGLPHGADSIKYALLGRTLWETLWLNVLIPSQHPEFQPTAGRPAAAAEVFPWLDRTLSLMPLGRADAGADRPVRRVAFHPAGIPMTRRYLLSAPETGRCDLTGLPGPVFRAFRRWPKGLRYEPADWWYPAVSSIKTSDSPPGQGMRFVRAQGPLRFDDWLETALFLEGDESQKKRLPLALAQWGRFADRFADALEERETPDGGATALSADFPFRVRAFAQYPFGKAIGGFSVRELPVWRVTHGAAARLPAEMGAIIATLGKAADCLAAAVRAAAKLGRKEGSFSIVGELRNSFLANLDTRVMELPGRLARAFLDPDEAARIRVARELRAALFSSAYSLALELFDNAFPLGGGAIDTGIAPQRSRLLQSLRAVLLSQVPPKSGKKGKGAP